VNLEEKLQQLKRAAQKSTRDLELERQLEYLRRVQAPKALPSQRVPRSIQDYVDGEVYTNQCGEFFATREVLPFGRPYGKLRIGDVATADFRPLSLFLGDAALPAADEVVYLDTETTGLVGGTGTCAFLIGVGMADSRQFVIRQFFLRDYPEEKAMLAALAEALAPYKCLVTFNGKTFDIPLLETRYALARMRSPFARMAHLDVLHPARRLWKLRLEHCELTHLERMLLGITRQGDVPGSEIPGIYFDYLRTGNPRGLQPVFYHNSLDIVTLAALALELARIIGAVTHRDSDGGESWLEDGAESLDLFSLSRIFERAGARDHAISTCRQALALGLPAAIEPRALWHLASQHKRCREYELASEVWNEIVRREEDFVLEALEELAIYHEHRRRDPLAALNVVRTALTKMAAVTHSDSRIAAFNHRHERLQRKSAKRPVLPLTPV
jgi:uncharacterized protein YprB with RNaseH-like and TPR domain